MDFNFIIQVPCDFVHPRIDSYRQSVSIIDFKLRFARLLQRPVANVFSNKPWEFLIVHVCCAEVANRIQQIGCLIHRRMSCCLRRTHQCTVIGRCLVALLSC